MRECADFVWNNGERSRQLGLYRPCPCGTCSKGRKGVGYLSFSDARGSGLTVWLEDAQVFRRLRRALQYGKDHLRHKTHPTMGHKIDKSQNRLNAQKTLQNAAPPKPDRIELLKQVRRATIDDQLHLLAWLQGKFEKIRPEKK